VTGGLLATVDAIVLDIEGTTTPIAFVYDVLFPFARTHLREFLRDDANTQAGLEAVAWLRDEWSADVERGENPPVWPPGPSTSTGVDRDEPPDGLAAYVEWLMDRDRKSPGLKRLQGLIWERGYRQGALKGEVFADLEPALARWHRDKKVVAIYSSGSELAQRLIFGHTAHGDLTPYFSRFFDTAVGPKTSPDSYRRIARELGRPAANILFVSDVTAELDAAGEAGYQTLLCVRPGNRPQVAGDLPVIESFDRIA
jgi:enolase-phosphatase E1